MSDCFKTENYENWDKVISIMKSDNYIEENDMELSDLAYEIGDLLGLELYDYGVGRICFGLQDNKVVKIATSKNGINANYREADTYKNLPDHLKKYFTTCFEVGEGYAVFEEVRGFLDFEEVETRKKEITSIIKEIEMSGVTLKDIGTDTIIRNWGIREDNSVAILDYAD